MRLKIKGTVLTIDYFFFVMLSLMLMYNSYATLSVLALSLMHELCHVVALIVMGGKVSTLRISAFGMVMTCDDIYRLSPFKEMFFVLAGPVSNIAFSVMVLPFNTDYTAYLSALSMLWGLFNLLPFTAWDGGKALNLLLLIYMKQKSAENIMKFLSVLTLVCLGAFGILLLIKNRSSYSVLIITLYLTIFLINKPMS